MKAPWAAQHRESKEAGTESANAEPSLPKLFKIHGWNFRAQNGPILDSQTADK